MAYYNACSRCGATVMSHGRVNTPDGVKAVFFCSCGNSWSRFSKPIPRLRTDGGDSSTAGLVIGGLVGAAAGPLGVLVGALAGKALVDSSREVSSTCGRCRGIGRPIRIDRRGFLFQCGSCGRTWLSRRGV